VFTLSLPHRSYWRTPGLQRFGTAQTAVAVLSSLALLLLVACVVLVIKSRHRSEDQSESFSADTITAPGSESEPLSGESTDMDTEATPRLRDSSAPGTQPDTFDVDE
jgi:hypothetical protein